MKRILLILVLVGLLGGWYFYNASTQKIYTTEEGLQVLSERVSQMWEEMALKLGADTVLPIAGFTYNLSGAGVSSSATSLTLASLTLPQNDYPIQDSDLSSTFYVTLEPGNRSRQEVVSCTTVTQGASTATLSGCTRGLSPITPYTASSTLQFSHAGGSQVIFSNPPQLYNQFSAKGNDETITGDWGFSVIPSSTDECTETDEFCTKTYIDNQVNQGAATSTESVGGIVELATQLEMASSTSDNWANQPRVIQSRYATSSPDVRGLYAIISQNNGYLKQAWLDFTETWAFTATTTISASDVNSNPLTLNSIPYQFPSTQGASSTVLATNGSGTLLWQDSFSKKQFLTTTEVSSSDSATTTLFSTTIPANTLGTNNAIECTIPTTNFNVNTSGVNRFEFAYGTASTTLTLTGSAGSSLTANGEFHVILSSQGTNSQKVSLSAAMLATTNTTLQWIGGSATTEPTVDSTVEQPMIFTMTEVGNAGAYTLEQALCVLHR